VALLVSKLLKSTDVMLEQLSNMLLNVVAFDVSKPLKSKLVNLVHPKNIKLKLVQLDVLRPDKSMEVQLEKLQNMPMQVCAITPGSTTTFVILLALPYHGALVMPLHDSSSPLSPSVGAMVSTVSESSVLTVHVQPPDVYAKAFMLTAPSSNAARNVIKNNLVFILV